MPCLLYCVAHLDSEVILNAVGVSDEPVRSQESSGLRIYWSEIADPETALAEGAARKGAELKYQQVLRQIVAQTTPIPFPFPVVLAELEAVEKYVEELRDYFDEALTRLGDTVPFRPRSALLTRKIPLSEGHERLNLGVRPRGPFPPWVY